MEEKSRDLCEEGSRDEDRDLIRDEVRYTVARFADEAGGPIRCVQCLSGCGVCVCVCLSPACLCIFLSAVCLSLYLGGVKRQATEKAERKVGAACLFQLPAAPPFNVRPSHTRHAGKKERVKIPAMVVDIVTELAHQYAGTL